MNGWLITGIVVGIIITIIIIIAMFLYAISLIKKDDFEDKDSSYLGLNNAYSTSDNKIKYIGIGYETYIFSIILGSLAGIYNIVKWIGWWSWKDTAEVNYFFILVLIGLIFFNAIQSFIVYENKYIILKKIGLSFFYCTFGFTVGLLISLLLLISVIYMFFKSGPKPTTYRLEDGTLAEAEKDLLGFETNTYKEKYGTRKFEGTGNNMVKEI